MENYNESIEKMKSLARRYHSDPEFRSRMDANPAATLRGEGYEHALPKEARVRLHHDDARTLHIVFPPGPIPRIAEDDEGLGGISGGYCYCSDCVGPGYRSSCDACMSP